MNNFDDNERETIHSQEEDVNNHIPILKPMQVTLLLVLFYSKKIIRPVLPVELSTNIFFFFFLFGVKESSKRPIGLSRFLRTKPPYQL